MVFLCVTSPVRTRIPETMQNPWQNNDSDAAGCTWWLVSVLGYDLWDFRDFRDSGAITKRSQFFTVPDPKITVPDGDGTVFYRTGPENRRTGPGRRRFLPHQTRKSPYRAGTAPFLTAPDPEFTEILKDVSEFL